MVSEAEAAEAKTRTEIALAAEAVLVAHAVAIADRLVALDAERAARRKQLDGLDRTWVVIPGAAQPRAIGLPPRVVRAFNGTISQTSGKWEACFRGLIADPEVEIPDPDPQPAGNRFGSP